MTRSSGGSRQPNRPNRDSESRRDLTAADSDDENYNSGSVSRSRPARRSAAASNASSETEPATAMVDLKKRGIALMADVIISFGLSMVIIPVLVVINFVVPIVTKIVTQQIVQIVLMLIRDYFYQGRGIGKNLMGLQVVDATTGQPPTLLQSIKRNILFYLPLLVTGLIHTIRFLPFGGAINSAVVNAVGLICTIYVVVLIPAECWYAFKEGRRLGDKIANTTVVESSMDFSKPL